MPTSRSARLVVGIAFLALAAGPLRAETAAEALARSARSYQALPRLAERLDYTVDLPDGRQDRKVIEYGRAGGRQFVALLSGDGTLFFHVTVADGSLRATQFNVGGAFVEAPFNGSLTAALSLVGADQIGITVPPGLAASEAADDAFVESLGFGVLPGLHPTSIESADGITSVRLSAQAGGTIARLDDRSGRLIGVTMTVGEGDSSVRLEGSIAPIEVPDDDPRWLPSIDGRRPVATFAELEASAFPLGQPAPDLEIQALDGSVVSLASLRGQVVVLDFWATWCVPCWGALEHVEELAKWAQASDLPISVWAVDTLEQTATFAEQASLAGGFLESRGLDLPVLVDVDDAFFKAMHSPGLPSTIVISPEGTFARYHVGVADDMGDVLRAEATALIESAE